MNLIFLDIDGVLSLELGNSSLNAAPTRNLKWLIHETGSDIILTSDRRVGKTLDQLNARFPFEVVDKTPFTGKVEEPRWTELLMWFSQNWETIQYPLKYVILDDIPEFGPLSKYHIHCKHKEGLTNEKVDRLTKSYHDRNLHNWVRLLFARIRRCRLARGRARDHPLVCSVDWRNRCERSV